MSDRAMALARRFEEVHNDVLELAWATTETVWLLPGQWTGWPLGGVFRHIARSYLFEANSLAAFISASPLPPEFVHWSNLDRWNEQFSVNRPKGETIALLQTTGPAASAFISSLSDDQFDCVRYFPLVDREVSAAQMVEIMLIAHPGPHLEEIRSVLAQSGATRVGEYVHAGSMDSR